MASNSRRVPVTMDEGLYRQVQSTAATLSVSASELIRLATVAYLVDHGLDARSALADQSKRRIGPPQPTGKDANDAA